MALFGGKKNPPAGANLDPKKAEFIKTNAKFLERCGEEFLRIAILLKNTRGELMVEQKPEMTTVGSDQVLYAWSFRDYQKKELLLPYLHFDRTAPKKDAVALTVRGMTSRYEKGLFIRVFEKTDIEVRFTNTLV